MPDPLYLYYTLSGPVSREKKSKLVMITISIQFIVYDKMNAIYGNWITRSNRMLKMTVEKFGIVVYDEFLSWAADPSL